MRAVALRDRLRVLWLVAFVAGCGAAAARPHQTTADEEVTIALADSVKLIRGGRYIEAERRLAAARSRAFEDPDLLERLDYYLATVMVYQGNIQRAAKLLSAHAQRAASSGDAASEAWMKSSTAWMRWAAGDLLGAVAENERISRIIGAEGEMDVQDRRSLLLSQMWDRAFFLLDYAVSLPETERTEALDKALAAKDEYDALARQPDDREALALLDAYFALRKGDTQAATRAVQELGTEPAGDARGLYVQILVAGAAGDSTRVDALRARLRRMVTLLTPLLERALESPVSGGSSSSS